MISNPEGTSTPRRVSTPTDRQQVTDLFQLVNSWSPRATIRVARTGTNTYRTAALPAAAPTVPYAFHLADDAARVWLIGAAFGNGHGTPAKDAAHLSAWLTSRDVPHLLCDSGDNNGGRHLWIRLRKPVTAAAAKELGQLLSRRYRSFDPTPLLNTGTGALAAPGSPHRSGGVVTPLTTASRNPLDALAWADQGEHPSVVADLCGYLSARTSTTKTPPQTATNDESSPNIVFAACAPRLAARHTCRLWEPPLAPTERGTFGRSRPLVKRLPTVPAAVPIFDSRGRTNLLVLDFDSKHQGPAAVQRDVDQACELITSCGGRVVVDRSTSGGMHVLIPLAAGSTFRVDDLRALMNTLDTRFPTLDKTPMLNERAGCITPPGSPCREGGHRQLAAPLADAVEAFTIRSAHDFILTFSEVLGVPLAHDLDLPSSTDNVESAAAPLSHSARFPQDILDFAETGVLPPHWVGASPSEGRQKVLAQAALRGWDLTDVVDRINDGTWAGLGNCYSQYRHPKQIKTRLTYDWIKACRFVQEVATRFRSCTHKKVDTGGDAPRERTSPTLSTWLASATAWADSEWANPAHRSTIQAVLQALAFAAAVSGEISERGIPTTGIGGRSLSVAAGMMPESTLWQVLREIRDIPGSPVLLIRPAYGVQPDKYALVPPVDIAITDIHLDRSRVEPVHAAWTVLGLRCRRVYELITRNGLTRPAEIFAAAHTSTSTGYEILAVLTTAGLITREHGYIAGPRSLTDIEFAHGLDLVRTERLERHRIERDAWRKWLDLKLIPPADPVDLSIEPPTATNVPWSDSDTEEYLAVVVATGPPPLVTV